MEQNPASKTVKGLSIAIMVLSILGIVASLFCFVSSAAIAGLIAGNSDQISQEISSASSSDSESDALDCIFDNLSNDQAEVLGKVLVWADTTDVKNLGTAIEDQDFDEIEDALLDACDNDAGDDVTKADVKEAAEALSSLSAADAKTIGEGIANLDALNIALVSADLMAGESDSGAVNTVKEVTSDGSAITGVAFLTAGFLSALFIFTLIASIITLIAGIMGMRNCENPNKLKGAFVMCIIGAVCAFLSGSIISLILLIIDAVYISKVRKQPAVVAAESPVSPVQ